MTLVVEKNFAATLERIERCDHLYVDLETTGLNVFKNDIMCGIAVEADKKSFYFPFAHVEGNLCISKIEKLAPLLSDPEKVYTGFNYGFDLKFMLKCGIPIAKHVEDVQTAAQLLNENEQSLALKNLSKKYLKDEDAEEEEKLNLLLASLGYGKGDMWRLSPEKVERYACDDVRLTRELRDFYVPHLKTWNLYDLWQEVNEYLLAITDMELAGMQLDMELLAQYREEAQEEAEKALLVIQKHAGREINPRSAKQLQKWLGLKSTAKDILEQIPDHPGVRELQDYRGWQRADANYYRKFLEVKDRDDVVHANLNMTGTYTGRLSCSKPPMHAIPKQHTARYWKIKDVFVAREGHTLLEADYSQAEMRIASYFGQEMVMIDKLLRGADIHNETAAELGLPRYAAKSMNFAVIYGIGHKKLAQTLRIPLNTAKDYLNRYHTRYPGFRWLLRRAEAVAEHRGYIQLFTGRLRHFNVSTAYTHKASSNIVQGSVAEMLRIAITRIHKELKIRMLLTVHDSILFEIPTELLAELKPKILGIMLDTKWCSVPMKVDLKRGHSWGTAEEETQ